MPVATDYGALMEGIYEAYSPRALDLLALIGSYCRSAGMTTDGPEDFSCDGYQWRLGVEGAPNGLVDVVLEIVEEVEVGTYGESFGVSFSLDVTTYDGAYVASITPENYTDGWVVDGRDPSAVLERFELISRSPALITIPDLIKTHR